MTTPTPMNPRALLSRRQVALKLDTSVSNVSRVIKRNADFPAPVLLDARGSFRWHEHEIDAWIDTRRRVPPEERQERTAAAVAAEGARRRATKQTTASAA